MAVNQTKERQISGLSGLVAGWHGPSWGVKDGSRRENRTAGSTVAGTPAPSFPVGWFPDLRIGDEGG